MYGFCSASIQRLFFVEIYSNLCCLYIHAVLSTKTNLDIYCVEYLAVTDSIADLCTTLEIFRLPVCDLVDPFEPALSLQLLQCCSYLGKGLIPCDPKLVFDIIRDPQNRTDYDELPVTVSLHER